MKRQMPIPIPVTKPTVIRKSKGWTLQFPDGTETLFTTSVKVEHILTTALGLWPYYEEPDSIHSRRADMVPSNLELLVCLCSDVEEAMRSELNENQKQLLFDTYTMKQSRKKITETIGGNYGNTYWKVQEALLNVVRYLLVEKRWDLLGIEDGAPVEHRRDAPRKPYVLKNSRANLLCKACDTRARYISPQGKTSSYCIQCANVRAKEQYKARLKRINDEEGRILDEC